MFALLALQSPSPTIQIKDGRIEISVADQVTVVGASVEGPEKTALFRSGDRFVAWDERGLTITAGGKSKSTKLRDVAVTPKLFSREEIQENVRLSKANQRSLEASVAVGWERLGDVVYFLVRWVGEKESPWLEAIVQVDLSAERPAPSLVGRFNSFAVIPLDGDGLSRVGDCLAIVTRGSGDVWSVQTLDPKGSTVDSFQVGSSLARYAWFDGNVWFVEATTYGTEVVGWFDCSTRMRQVQAEARAKISCVSREPRLIKIVGRRGASLRWLPTGSEIRLPPATGVAAAKGWVVLFSPEPKPTKATLYAPERWTVVAEWPKPSAGGRPSASRPAVARGRSDTPPTRRVRQLARPRQSPTAAATRRYLPRTP